MVSRVFACTAIGLQCHTVEVQADVTNGLPSFHIVGLGDTLVQESKERVKSGIRNSGAQFPQIKKTINLAPAEIRKSGSQFDLPIALSILLASKQLEIAKIDFVIVGELSLTGKVKQVSSILPMVQHAKKHNFKRIFIPAENVQEASYVDGIEIYPVRSLRELICFFQGQTAIKPAIRRKIESYFATDQEFEQFNEIVGLEKEKKGAVISAAGGHNMLLMGSPGCGKTILCRTFKFLLPPMSSEEIFSTSSIYSVAGLLKEQKLITNRPFREIHHNTTLTAITGGGNTPQPGEISLAHNGVLFFDEVAEFKQNILETLRKPLEDQFITITRSKYTFSFPSNFIFLATMNPCPCGFKLDSGTPCICTETQIKNYQRKLSGPLKDRIDIFLKMSKIKNSKLLAKSAQPVAAIKQQIITAHNRQIERFKGVPNHYRNKDLRVETIKKLCLFSRDAKRFLGQLAAKQHLSARAYLKIIKVAQTIADLEDSHCITEAHLSEAFQFRDN